MNCDTNWKWVSTKIKYGGYKLIKKVRGSKMNSQHKRRVLTNTKFRAIHSLYNPGFLQLLTANEANKLIELKWNHRFVDGYVVQEISTRARMEHRVRWLNFRWLM